MALGVLILDRGVSDAGLHRWSGTAEEVALAHPSETAAVVGWTHAAGLSDVLVVARPRDRAEALRLATLLAGAQPGLAATVHVAETTTLAMAVTASAVLEQRLEAPLAHAAVAAGLSESVSGAVLRRVTRLDNPRPSMWQHLTSIFGRRHVALLSERSVVRAGAPITLPESAVILATSLEGAAAGVDAATIFGADAEVLMVPEVTPVQAAFGSDGFEFVAFAPPALPAATATCHICGNRLAAPLCPFCRVRSVPQELVL